MGDRQLVSRIDDAHRRACAAESDLVQLCAQVDASGVWRDDGARDAAHWLAMRFGVSQWKARRWIAAGQELPFLPAVGEAFDAGRLGVDKVVELTRFAEPDTEDGLVEWAARVSPATIRRRADLSTREDVPEVEAQRARYLRWWFGDEGRRFGLEGELPAAQGAIIAKTLDPIAAELPVMPDEEGSGYADARRADALSALVSAEVAADPDPDRATLVVHADVEALRRGTAGAEIEDGPVIHPATLQRLGCNARIQTVIEDGVGNVRHVGSMKREPAAWQVRQVRHRDKGCVFPGCGARAFTQVHHIQFWSRGGRTELDNLVLICAFHHKLVHEMGWSLRRQANGSLEWLRPGGERYRAGPLAPQPPPAPPAPSSLFEASSHTAA